MSDLPFLHSHTAADDSWLSTLEGQLSVDVIENAREIIVRSTVAGVKSEDLDISVTTDTLTIRGKREACTTSHKEETIHMQVWYWGAFSRSLVLPHTVSTDKVKADLQNGVLTITLKKTETATRIPVSHS